MTSITLQPHWLLNVANQSCSSQEIVWRSGCPNSLTSIGCFWMQLESPLWAGPIHHGQQRTTNLTERFLVFAVFAATFLCSLDVDWKGKRQPLISIGLLDLLIGMAECWLLVLRALKADISNPCYYIPLIDVCTYRPRRHMHVAVGGQHLLITDRLDPGLCIVFWVLRM